LLHAALHAVLGEHARQAGSLVAPDRLRFDFNHPEAMTPGQVERVEKIVNDAVAADMQVLPKLKARADAISEGAMALFGEKYGGPSARLRHAAGRQGAPSCWRLTTATADRPPVNRSATPTSCAEDPSALRCRPVLIVGEASAGGVALEAVTGRGAYDPSNDPRF
jgi:alanyl-tRNA synthetase